MPELVQEGGHEIIIERAQIGGCSLEQHWNAVEAAERDPNSTEGKLYDGKSLRDLMEQGTWDIVTMQQYSMRSSDVQSYHPYIEMLREYVVRLQPQAEIVLHQTWAYRRDAQGFSFISAEQQAQNQHEMWQKSRATYHEMANLFGARLIPTGDAFWKIDSDPKWGYQEDTSFDFGNPVYPTLPDQTHSLHVGYFWNETREFSFDANHANAAGCYLGALVWYGFLFKESPEPLSFVPPDVPADFAAHLRHVAWQVVQAQANSS